MNDAIKRTAIYGIAKKIYNSAFIYWIYNRVHHNSFNLKGRGNKIQVGKSRLKNCSVSILGDNNSLIIGNECVMGGVRVLILGNNNEIIIGDNVFMNGSTLQPIVINACENSRIIIGRDCMFSNNIEIHTSDYHSILDNLGNRINAAKDVFIENHVWVGFRCTILKGSHISENSIVASNSVVNKRFNEPSSLLAGIPAKIKKENINWDKRLL